MQPLLNSPMGLGRLLHYSMTVNFWGKSYRLKDRRKAGLIPQPKRREETK